MKINFAVFFALTTHSFAGAEVVGACGNHHSRSASEESHSDARECIEQSCDHFSLHFCPRSGITRCIFTKLFLINHHFSMPFLMFFGIKMRMKFMEKCECIFSILVVLMEMKLIKNLWLLDRWMREKIATSTLCDPLSCSISSSKR